MMYFGFAIADGMFPEKCCVRREPLTVEQVRERLQGGAVEFCLNPSHTATVEAARHRFSLPIEVPSAPPRVSLRSGDSLIVMSVRGLPRLTENRHYNNKEVQSATFVFAEWTVEDTP